MNPVSECKTPSDTGQSAQQGKRLTVKQRIERVRVLQLQAASEQDAGRRLKMSLSLLKDCNILAKDPETCLVSNGTFLELYTWIATAYKELGQRRNMEVYCNHFLDNKHISVLEREWTPLIKALCRLFLDKPTGDGRALQARIDMFKKMYAKSQILFPRSETTRVLNGSWKWNKGTSWKKWCKEQDLNMD